MKKYFMMAALGLFMVLGASTLNAQNCIPTEQQAIQTVRSACGNTPPQGMTYVASLQDSGECEGGGCYFTYNVYLVGKCPGYIDPALCDPIVILKGTWYQGCNGFGEVLCIN